MIALESLFDLLPQARLEQLACRYQIDRQHNVRLPGPVVFLCLLNGLLNHVELSQRLLEDTFAKQTGRKSDHSSFGKCLEKLPSDYFADLFAQLYAKMTPAVGPGDLQALRVRRIDATTVTLSAKLLSWGLSNRATNQHKTLRHLKSVLELSADNLPQLLKVCKDPSDKSDCVALGDTMLAHTHPGDLWIFDKGCHDRQRLLKLHQAGSFWLTPHSQQALKKRQPLFEAAWADKPLSAPPAGSPTFVVVRVEQVTFGNGQETGKEQANWDQMPLLWVQGYRFDTRTKAWKPLELLTNLPLSAEGFQAGTYTWDDLFQLYASRWEIEVFFKFIKQHLSYSHLLSRSPNGVQIMIYMSLIAALLLIWYKQQTGIDRGWRSVKFWLAEQVRHWTEQQMRSTLWEPDD